MNICNWCKALNNRCEEITHSKRVKIDTLSNTRVIVNNWIDQCRQHVKELFNHEKHENKTV